MSKSKYATLKEEKEYNELPQLSERNQNDNEKENLKIFLRDALNKTIELSFLKSEIKTIKDLKSLVRLKQKLESIQQIKLIFKGKILEDNKSLEEYKIENDDVLLYMICANIEQSQPSTNSNQENDTSIVSQHLQNGVENFHDRGFNRFRTLGMPAQELNMFRMLFHAMYMSQHRNETLDWSPQALLQREEEWINTQNAQIAQTRQNRQNLQQQRERIGILRNVIDNSRINPARLIFLGRNNNNNTRPPQRSNSRQNGGNSAAERTIQRNALRLRRVRQDYQDFFTHDHEPNHRLILGFLIGLILNFYGLVLLLFCEFRPKFKTGLQIGVIFGGIFFLFGYNSNKY